MTPENTAFTFVRAYDGTLIQVVPKTCADSADTMLARVETVWCSPAGPLPVWRRIESLRTLMGLMVRGGGDFAALITAEGGKQLVDARAKVKRAIHGVDLAAIELSNEGGREIPMGVTQAGAGRLAFAIKEPIGIVVVVSAFNHTLNLIVHQVIPAVATGCPVTVKPAGPPPLNCLRLVELLCMAGLPAGWCQVCVCDNDVAEKLVANSRVAFFSFIGSSRVGWHLRSKLAPGTRCALEHGGAAPVIVSDDADFEMMLPLLVKGGYYHAGQVCVSIQRIFVDNAVKADFVERYRTQVARLTVGDPASASTEVGLFIRPGEVDGVERWVNETIDAGAQCIEGGARMSERVFAPTVLVDPPGNVSVSTSEMFAPVTCVYGFAEMDEAIARANALHVAFQVAVFKWNIHRAFHAVRRLDTTAVMVNDHTAFRIDWMPFAGRRTSGLGVGGIGHTMADMSQDKMMVINA